MAQYGAILYGNEIYGNLGAEALFLNNIALLIGGTQPDPVGNPYWYSGAQVKDGTGLSGLDLYGQSVYGLQSFYGSNRANTFKGCYSRPPFVVEEAPCGIVFTGSFRSSLNFVIERQDDAFRLVILVKKVDSRTDFAILNRFRDMVPQVFRKHLTLFGAVNVLQAFVRDGRAIGMEYAGERWWAWEYTISVIRLPSAHYQLH